MDRGKKKRSQLRRPKDNHPFVNQQRCLFCSNRPWIHIDSMKRHMRRKHPGEFCEKVENQSTEMPRPIAETKTVYSQAKISVETNSDGFGELVLEFFLE